MNSSVLAILTLLYAFYLNAQEQTVDTSPDVCRCYCCPSSVNPGGQGNKKCNATSPPLVGSVPIGGGAGAASCNPLGITLDCPSTLSNHVACNSYFAAQCPPVSSMQTAGAAIKAGCRSCPDGPFGNGTAPNGQGGEVGGQINNYINNGGSLGNSASKLSPFNLKWIFQYFE